MIYLKRMKKSTKGNLFLKSVEHKYSRLEWYYREYLYVEGFYISSLSVHLRK